jgi:hypothetical protein
MAAYFVPEGTCTATTVAPGSPSFLLSVIVPEIADEVTCAIPEKERTNPKKAIKAILIKVVF